MLKGGESAKTLRNMPMTYKSVGYNIKRKGSMFSNKVTSAAVSMTLAASMALSPMGGFLPHDIMGATAAYAQTSQMSIKLTGDEGGDGIINDAETGVSRNMREMTLDIGESFRLSDEREGGDPLSGIRIYANGIDETYKFEIQKDAGSDIKFDIKLKDTSVGSDSAYKLRKFALYTIYIPEGTFETKAGEIPCGAVSHSFITDTDEERISSTIKASFPKDGDKNVAADDTVIAFEFPYDVEFAEGIIVDESGRLQNPSDFISISTTPVSPYIPS